MLMSYALHGGIHRHSMDTLSEKYLGHIPVSIKSLMELENRNNLTLSR